MDPQSALRTRVIVHTYNPHIGSFLPSLGSLTNQSLLGGRGGRHCYEIRDRDRLRQQQLENLGWRFHRIWSTDQFMRKEQEVQRTLTAFQSAVKFADQLDRGVASPNQDESNHRHTAPSSSARGPRPGVPVRPSIQQYSVGELAQLMRWIASDGQLRTDDEIMDEMVATLGFSRRGARIESAIRGAISRWRAQI